MAHPAKEEKLVWCPRIFSTVPLSLKGCRNIKKDGLPNLIVAHLLSLLAGTAVIYAAYFTGNYVLRDIICIQGEWDDLAILPLLYICILTGSLTSGWLLTSLASRYFFYLVSPIWLAWIIECFLQTPDIVSALYFVPVPLLPILVFLLGFSIIIIGITCYPAKAKAIISMKTPTDKQQNPPEVETGYISLWQYLSISLKSLISGSLFGVLVHSISLGLIYLVSLILQYLENTLYSVRYATNIIGIIIFLIIYFALPLLWAFIPGRYIADYIKK